MAEIKLQQVLFPNDTLYQEGYLKVSSIHEIWYAQYGNSNGVPVIVLHGGPGAGCDEDTVKFFDPTFWRVILLDQRAAKRSKPFNAMQENTTQHLIADMETLRKELSVDQWVIFGGSWGSTLALAYGQTHPSRVLGFILRGIFLGSEQEKQHLWYGMSNFFPDAWQEFNDFIPTDQQHDLINAYYQLLMSSNPDIALPAARAFAKYDFICSMLNLPQEKLEQLLSDNKLVLGITRAFTHYSVNDFFLKENQLIDNIHIVHHLPLIIVHGRYDVITQPKTAYELHKLWPNSELVFVDAAGHSAKEPQIMHELQNATEKMKHLI